MALRPDGSSRDLVGDLAALPAGPMPDTAPFAHPTKGPRSFVAPDGGELIIPDRWVHEAFGEGGYNGPPEWVTGSTDTLTRLPSRATDWQAGWSGWSHKTAVPTGTYRWSQATAVNQNASSIELLTMGLACAGPDGDTAGIYIEHGLGHSFAIAGDRLAHVRIVGPGGELIADLPWEGVTYSQRATFFYEAVIAPTAITLRAFIALSGTTVYTAFGSTLTWTGPVPQGPWTNAYLFSNKADFGVRNQGPDLVWLAVKGVGETVPILRNSSRDDGLTSGRNGGGPSSGSSGQAGARNTGPNSYL
jgi:hypothetical protein